MSYQVAKEIVAHCPSCKMDLNHIIVAMDADRIVRVICLTCHKEHAYHRPHEERSQKRREPKRGAPRKKPAPLSGKWEQLEKQHLESTPKPYTLQGVYSTGDKLSHPRFGIGFVTRVIEPGKMEVIFRDGQKRMAFGSGDR